MHIRATRARAAALALACLAMVSTGAGCGTVHPRPLDRGSLAEAQTFPYFRLYWVGLRFDGRPLAAVDGLRGYNSRIGDSVYYGDCVTGKGVLGGGGSCALPLQITTVVYQLHSNAPLGSQRNALIAGVPATVYDEGRSIELYSGRLAVDVSSNTPALALQAAQRLTAINVRGPDTPVGRLQLPVYCPGLSGPVGSRLQRTMAHLPGHPCQRANAALTAASRLAQGSS